MFVYGVRCAPNDLLGLPANATADYYLDYGLLVFPTHTRASYLQNTRASGITPEFWHRARLMIQFPSKTHTVTHLEQPWLSEGEGAVIEALQEFYPRLQPDWYYVPRTVTQGSDPSSEDD